jgi:methionine synthase II (cobalamin-independent)
MSRIGRLAAAVPADVDLGLHLCYGDRDAKHFVDPQDAAKMTEFANALSNAIARKIAYIHMPVPIDRTDEEYFKPFAGLRLHPETQIFLGLVHADGVDATRARIAVANKYVPRFGIATECGIARKRSPELVRSLLEIHAHVSEEPH